MKETWISLVKVTAVFGFFMVASSYVGADGADVQLLLASNSTDISSSR